MKILVIWRLLTVGGVNAGWRNRAMYFQKHGIVTEFLYTTDLGGMHIMQDVAPVYLTKVEQEIVGVIERNSYDAIVVVDTGDAYRWIRKANFTGPVIVEVRTPEILKLKPHVQGFAGVRPAAFVVPSCYQKRLASILVDDIPIEVIYNGVDLSFFHPIPFDQIHYDTEPFLPSGKKIVGWIGRLDKRKNWPLLLRIARLIRKERDDIEFWVIGGAQSVQRDEFAAKWKEEQLTEIVKWFPVVPYQEMPHVYAKIRQSGGCTLATTKGESFGNTFIESMACGVPVVAPKITSIPELVLQGETGRLYREEHARGATRQIYRVVDNPTVYHLMSQAAVERAQNQFAINRCAEAYIRLLKRVVVEGGRL
ncbi:glycosyltransferase family 4 protein [Effusibacillus pohliae]|uniref:glycosyltransferase family 4 protein n=1 Tax=Effusibacillus pohliae TaxID=232270 RepID=UPI00037A6986|nr:glycosyltransferase family 4 protein [Effusibacillus pohliae]